MVAKIGYAQGTCPKCGKTLRRRRPADYAVCDCYQYCPLCGKKMNPYTHEQFSGTFYVRGSYDDTHEQGDGISRPTCGAVEVWSNTNPNSENYNCGGFRFREVTIPHGAIILAAKFTGYIYSDVLDDVNAKIYANDADDAKDFQEIPQVVSEALRPRTSAYVSWVQDGLGVGWKEKAGLESIIQEIVNRSGWQSGNAIALLFIANMNTVKKASIYQWDHGPEAVPPEPPGQYAAKLEVTYTLPSPDLTPSTYGPIESEEATGDTESPINVLYYCPDCEYHSSLRPVEVILR